MITVGSLWCHLGRGDGSFEDDFGVRRDWQVDRQRLSDARPAATQHAREGQFVHAVRHGHDGCQYRRRIGPDRDCNGHVPADGLQGMVPGPTSARQPAHQQTAAIEYLHAVDADIDIGRVVRRARDHQRPGHQRRRLTRPAPLDGQVSQVDLAGPPLPLLNGRPTDLADTHGQSGLGGGQTAQGCTQVAGDAGLAQERQRFRDPGNCVGLNAEAEGNAPSGAEQVDQNGHRHPFAVAPDDLVEQQCRASLGEDATMNLGQLVHEAYGARDAV